MKVLIVPSITTQALQHARMLAARLDIAGLDTQVYSAKDASCEHIDVSDLALVVVMGGDGTFLFAARLIGFASVPILAFNYGDLGFLSGNPDRDEVELVFDALSGDLALERRSTLEARVTDVEGNVSTYAALNEIAYTRGASGHVVEYTMGVNGTNFASLKADGLVVATATGSTAYALSAGGPIVSPAYGGLVAVPLAPHSLVSRAIVTAPSDVIEVTMTGRAINEASLFVDGVALEGCAPSSMSISRSDKEIVFVRAGKDFFASVAHAFYGGGVS